MTSQINFAAINITYPVAGQDNDSQGFRDNFTVISAGLATASTEITAVQQNAVLVADLATSSTPVVNNLLGSTLAHGLHNQLNGVVYPGGTVTSAVTINVDNGPFQTFILNGNTTMSFSGWPATGEYAVIRVKLSNADALTTKTPTLTTVNGGNLKLATGFPSPFNIGTTGKIEVIEAWTIDGGANVYVKLVGEW
jgi:hypothetical protein